ncbi:hypothetical protein fugu_002311 [Takifugu bimaculatus]|uniref:IGFBP N-terminal domain-containing protein n=1 Tax=Takifugu bimaculatus TaxID=433685 RepID=A0A4Z2BPF6_9TELE|nr:hypothetical protein fugu_002311 [Takifugu bimaculatus]
MIMTKNLLPLTMLLYVSCNLLIISASLAGASLAEMVFRCPGCTAERQALCPKLTETCAEIVREPGCGCCPVCARQEGEMCGVYTPRCATGLRCYPTPNSELPLEQLVQGQGQCRHKVDTEAATYSQEQREQTSGEAVEAPPEQGMSDIPAIRKPSKDATWMSPKESACTPTQAGPEDQDEDQQSGGGQTSTAQTDPVSAGAGPDPGEDIQDALQR